mmetsp:Transcript_28674/g.78828  ORF Transcript_28674/g.78828 Transcript_28674/m.78828 type:complete len:442 (-) Transcript_28674:54-1379(-)
MLPRRLWWFFFLETSLVVARSHAAASLRSALTLKGHAYNYAHHGQEWTAGQCGSRERQSPIDFGAVAPWECDASALTRGPCFSGDVFYAYENVTETPDRLPQGSISAPGVLGLDLSGHGYGGITLNDAWFEIESLAFRSRSEHTFRGRRLPLEMQLVHKREDSPHMLIVSVLFDTALPQNSSFAAESALRALLRSVLPGVSDGPGKAPSVPVVTRPSPTQPVVDFDRSVASTSTPAQPVTAPGDADTKAAAIRRCRKLLRSAKSTNASAPPVAAAADTADAGAEASAPRPAPATPSEGPEAAPSAEPLTEPLDLMSPFFAGGSFFAYSGSLTVPPCVEQVTWLVRRDALPVSEAEAARLRAAVLQSTDGDENWRSAMPTMGRSLSVLRARRGRPPLEAEPLESRPRPPVVRTARFRGIVEARAALDAARRMHRIGEEVARF